MHEGWLPFFPSHHASSNSSGGQSCECVSYMHHTLSVSQGLTVALPGLESVPLHSPFPPTPPNADVCVCVCVCVCSGPSPCVCVCVCGWVGVLIAEPMG